MKYNEIVEMNKHFRPAYVINEEELDLWKQFIPNAPFNNILKFVLKAINSTLLQERKSIWVQGTYGTGKSHAAAVIKHILWDNYENIKDYTEQHLSHEFSEEIKNFKSNNSKKIFPVVIKGVSGIVDNRTFVLVIERAVKEALKNFQIQIHVDSDFDKWIKHVEENPINIDWNKLIKENNKLNIVIKDKEDLILKLKNQDIQILTIMDEIFSQSGTHFSTDNIGRWLNEVVQELKQQEKATGLMIFWDEFTSILELSQCNSILNEIQNISELTPKGEIFLYIICHRSPEQTKVNKEEIKKILGRFSTSDYSMNPLTTYHIIAASVKKIDENKWNNLKEIYINKNPYLLQLISNLSGNQDEFKMKDIKNLFPIHPYTGYLATYIARCFGSSQRSIFNFLHDQDKGFIKFINEYPNEIKNEFFLTSEWLFDYFAEEFENLESEKINSILNTYYVNKTEIQNLGLNHLKVFKVILIFNILHLEVYSGEEIKFLVPSTENIKKVFCGTNFENDVDSILQDIDSKGYIPKTPDDKFLILTAGINFQSPDDENIKNEQEKYFENITKIIEYCKEQLDDLKNNLKSKILRETEIKIYYYSTNTTKNILKNNLSKDFKNNYTLHFACFVIKEENEKAPLNKIIEEISKEFKDIIFVIFNEPLKIENFNKFIQYVSRSLTADKYNDQTASNTFKKYAIQYVEKWIKNIKERYVTLIYNNSETKTVIGFSGFDKIINQDLSCKIFSSGLENLKNLKNENIWKIENSENSIEQFLFASSRKEAIDKARGVYTKLLDIIKSNDGNFIVNETFEIEKDKYPNHPLLDLYNQVTGKFDELENKRIINLSKELEFLTYPPYGLYSNKIHMAVMGFIMNKFLGKLYDAKTGKIIEKNMMRDKIKKLFKSWNDKSTPDDLNIRFGTEEEKELTNKLISIFNISKTDNFNEVIQKINEWINSNNSPIWIFKSPSNNEIVNNTIDKIFFILSQKEISDEQVKETLKLIKINEFELRLNFTKQDVNKVFYNYLINKIDFNDNDFNELFSYLEKKLNKKICEWTESDVTICSQEWHIQKLKKIFEINSSDDKIPRSLVEKIPEEDIKENSSTPESEKQQPKLPANAEDIKSSEFENYKDFDKTNKYININNQNHSNSKNLINKIKSYDGDFKELIIKLIGQIPNLAEKLNEYL